MAENQRELQLLPSPSSSRLSGPTSDSSSKNQLTTTDPFDSPSLDLQLSINVRPVRSSADCLIVENLETLHGYHQDMKNDIRRVEALKRHTAEQIRQAAVEKAYAEQVRELTRREMELAESDFARARSMWEQARGEVEKVERMKEKATRRVDPTCMEITCQSCRHRFRA